MEIFIGIILSITIAALGDSHGTAKHNGGSNTDEGTKNAISFNSFKHSGTHVHSKHKHTNEPKHRGLLTSSEEDKISNNHNRNKNDDNKKVVRNVQIGRTEINTKGHIRKLFAPQASLMDTKRSTICSPLSALLPAAKLVYGATGHSKRQLLAAVGASNEDKLSQSIVSMFSSLRDTKGVTLDIASKIYVDKTTRLTNNFRKKIQTVFEATCESLDTSHPNRAANQVNKFVKHTTHGLIKSIVEPEYFKDPISVLIVNAVYFKGQWRNGFGDIRLVPFHGGTRRQVTMMTRTHFYKYYKSHTLKAQIVGVPYEGDDAYFVLVIPNKSNGLRELLRLISTSDALETAISLTTYEPLNLTIPKFTIERTFDLIKLYRKCHISDIFSTDKSGLTNMALRKKLYVSKAVHKATIEVSENGTIAAASSVGGTNDKALPLIGKSVVADRPFFFTIISGSEILFSGTFTGK